LWATRRAEEGEGRPRRFVTASAALEPGGLRASVDRNNDGLDHVGFRLPMLPTKIRIGERRTRVMEWGALLAYDQQLNGVITVVAWAPEIEGPAPFDTRGREGRTQWLRVIDPTETQITRAEIYDDVIAFLDWQNTRSFIGWELKSLRREWVDNPQTATAPLGIGFRPQAAPDDDAG
jgi:hypothetical protein